MKIGVYFFALTHEITGTKYLEYEIPEGEKVSFLVKQLQCQFHDFLEMKFMIAVNSEYVETDHDLHDGDRVSIIPPVSGG